MRLFLSCSLASKSPCAELVQPHPLPAAISNKETPCYASLGPRWHAASKHQGATGFRVFRSPGRALTLYLNVCGINGDFGDSKFFKLCNDKGQCISAAVSAPLEAYPRNAGKGSCRTSKKLESLMQLKRKALSLSINSWLAINSCSLIVFSLTVDSNFCSFVSYIYNCSLARVSSSKRSKRQTFWSWLISWDPNFSAIAQILRWQHAAEILMFIRDLHYALWHFLFCGQYVVSNSESICGCFQK